MTDIVERLRSYASDDHERLCQGRYYNCSCGYDDKRDPLMTEAAAEIERLRAALEPKPLDENAPKDRMLIGLERPPCEDKTYYSMVQWREDTQQWMMEAGVDWSFSPGRCVWAYCGVSHYLDPLDLPGLPYWDGKDEEDEEDGEK
jgi:hypothetical protein